MGGRLVGWLLGWLVSMFCRTAKVPSMCCYLYSRVNYSMHNLAKSIVSTVYSE